MKFKITLLLFFCFAISSAQVTNQSRPLSWKLNTTEKVEAAIMPAFNVEALLQEDKKNERSKEIPWRFAHEFTVNYTMRNSGSWLTLPNGDRIWRMHFKSNSAKSMHFWLRDFYIPKGATLYIYNNEHSDVLGAYDSRQNSSSYLGTWPVAGDDVWIEYFEPAAQTGQGKFEVFKVGHAYRDIYHNKTGTEVLSEDCNYDVECFVEGVDNLKNINKRSVNRIIGSVNDGAFLASGALVNNTANDGTPYILSANHAWVETAMYTFRFNWINPEPACPSSTDGDDSINEVQTISGAILRARRQQSDFMLLELTGEIPTEWNLVWSGWDRTENIPPYTYGIHHPGGDIMKVCLDVNEPVLLNNNEGESTWNVLNWEIGTTEGGSSGSPLLDNFGRIRGQLWRGASWCNGNEPNGAGDEYGRFNKSWDEGSTPAERLKEWLDPDNTGATTVDFYPPQTLYAIDAKTILFELGHNDCENAITPVIRLINNGSQNLTSAQISYAINQGTPIVLNWTGNLTENNSTLINLPQLTGIPGDNVFTVTITGPNGETDANPGNNTFTSHFIVPEIYAVTDVTLNLLTDNFAEEISWSLTNEFGTVLYSAGVGTYDNAENYSNIFNLTEAGCYTFTIRDGYGDGICCTQGEGNYSLTTATGEVIAQGGDYGHGESVTFKLEEPMSVGGLNSAKGISVYPNPSTGIFTVSNAGSQRLQYTLYTVLGQEVLKGTLPSDATINARNTASGVYLLTLTDEGGNAKTIKLVKE